MSDVTDAAADVEGDDGQRYGGQVNAPLTSETLEALRAQLESDE